MSNGVTNALIFTVHKGDYSFVDRVTIDGVRVGYTEIPEKDMQRAASCLTQELGHKVPATSLRKADGRIIGSCEKCYARVNIARFPGTEAALEAAGLWRTVLFDVPTEHDANVALYLPGVENLTERLEEDLVSLNQALADMRRAKALLVGRIARAKDDEHRGAV